VPDEVLSAMHRPAVDIYSGGLVDITTSLLDDLRTLFATKGRTYIYASNGHGVWEAALGNVLSRGDRVLVLESGRFATSWGDMAARMGALVDVLPGEYQRAVRPAEVAERLAADTAHAIKAILLTQIDTASGVANDVAAIAAAARSVGHPALVMVDTVASLACMPFEMDAWGIDVAVAGSQKGLMTPPGLGLIAAGERAVAAHPTADLVTPYWDWTAREGPEHYQKYCGTPPEHLLFGLRKAIDMLMAEGLDNAYQRHRLLAGATQAAVERWSQGGVLGFNVEESGERAVSVTTVRWRESEDSGQALQALTAYARERCGVVLGKGIGALGGKAFRIAHMGHVNAPMLLGTLGVVEMALKALKVPHGSGGIEAAVEYLAARVEP